MGLVDLRGRTDDAAVTALVAQLPRQAETSADAPPPRLLLGWTVDGELVGCLGVEGGNGRELELKNLFVLEEHVTGHRPRPCRGPRGRGARGAVRCALRERRGGVLRAARVRSRRRRLTRPVGSAVTAAPGDVAALTLADLEAAIRRPGAAIRPPTRTSGRPRTPHVVSATRRPRWFARTSVVRSSSPMWCGTGSGSRVTPGTVSRRGSASIDARPVPRRRAARPARRARAIDAR